MAMRQGFLLSRAEFLLSRAEFLLSRAEFLLSRAEYLACTQISTVFLRLCSGARLFALACAARRLAPGSGRLFAIENDSARTREIQGLKAKAILFLHCESRRKSKRAARRDTLPPPATGATPPLAAGEPRVPCLPIGREAAGKC